MPSLRARIFKLYARNVIRRRPPDQHALVRHLRRTMNNSPLPALLPSGVSIERTTAAGRPCDVVSVSSPTSAVLYLHGGAYVAGVTRTYHALAGRLAAGLQAEVILPDYRLAPEHPFPAAHEDALAAYDAVLARGHSPDDIVIAGDSAGGGLSLALLLAIRDRGLPRPRCGVLFSPYTDVTASSASVDGNDRSDAMLSAHMLRLGIDMYHGDEDPRHPYVSPAYADFRDLPPLYVTVCEDECLRDDALAVAESARRANVPVELVRRPGLMHVWPVFVPYMPEAREDVARVIDFLRGVGGP